MRVRATVTLLAIGAMLALAGCSRRSRIAPPGQPTAAAVDPSPTPGAPLALPAALTAAANAPPSPTPAIGASLAPLWDDLESTLGELDSALSGVEDWEVTVP